LWSSTTYTKPFGSVADPRRPLVRAAQLGRALRDAPPRMPDPREERPRLSPILLISHGLYSHRLAMISLAERLSSHGFVVLACDHPGSTCADASLGATLAFWHHPLDVRALLSEIERLEAGGSGGPLEFLRGMADFSSVAVLGHSMGGYAALCVAGITPTLHRGINGIVPTAWQAQWDEVLKASAPQLYDEPPPACLRAVVPIAPYGMACSTWSREAVNGLHCPALLIAGDQDRVSGYLRGVRRLFSTGPAPTDRFLLTHRGGTHNDVVPFVPPTAVQEAHLPNYLPSRGVSLDTRRVCDLNVHFIGLFLQWAMGRHASLDLGPNLGDSSETALHKLVHPISSGSFDHELPAVEMRSNWPFSLQHAEDSSALGFALEHAPSGTTGPIAPPAWLYAWE